MTKYVLDTNVWIFLLYKKPVEVISKVNTLLSEDDTILILPDCIIAEIKSIAYQRNFGEKKLNNLNNIIEPCFIVHTTYEIVDAYAKIDAFSQGKLKGKNLGMSARNMGKNDLWIAATTCVTDSILITTDKDFDHLDPEFIKVIRFNPEI